MSEREDGRKETQSVGQKEGRDREKQRENYRERERIQLGRRGK